MKKIIASNHFIKAKKKSPEELQLRIDRQVELIIADPQTGELKTGDLKGVRVHKFKYGNQLYLLSYEDKEEFLYLYTVAPHENFYKKLKQFLK